MIYNWIINTLVFSMAPLILLCVELYKENKKLKHINKIQAKIIEQESKKQ